jgi:hypothetical protein
MGGPISGILHPFWVSPSSPNYVNVLFNAIIVLCLFVVLVEEKINK